jgi:uncharacterized membrane protein
MAQNIKAKLSGASLKDILYLIALSSLIDFFLTINSENPGEYSAAVTAFFLTLGCVFLLWLYFLSGTRQAPSSAYKTAGLSLAPVFILLLLLPYNYFYAPLTGMEPWACLGLVCAGSVLFNALLRNKLNIPPPSPVTLGLLMALYAASFSAISVLRHLNYQNDSSFDVAIYSQIQWSNIHGHLFHTSSSGSNFVTHNSPFLLLLSPFYALYPHPETLLVLKTLFLACGAFPFYLILKHLLGEKCLWPLLLGYLFFPFIVGQNFNAPHETCFLPPLLLFSFYDYLKGRFKPFLVFLVLSLSIKEHMALMAVMYGLYALYQKKERHWVIVPLLMGAAWAIFSMWVIFHFQKIYHVDPYPAWLIDNIKRRILRPDHSTWSNMVWSLQTSNMGHWGNFCYFYLLLSPVCLVLPFFSSIWLLGLPELFINLLATIPLTYPTWHYNVVVAIFLLLSCAGTVKKSPSGILSRLGLPAGKSQELLSWFLCICILVHFPLWWDYTKFKTDPRYAADMNSAIRLVPEASSVSLTKHLVAYVSDRKDYFLCEERRKGEYIVLDKDETMGICFKDLRQADGYVRIFEKDGIRVYRKKQPIP